MDRFAAMVVLLGVLVSSVLILLALFAVAPVICSCLVSLLYSLYLFMAYEESGVHHAQEFENRFWTIFGLLLSTALFFAKDSPVAFGIWSPSFGFVAVILSGYGMHLWDRYVHRIAMSQSFYQLRRMNYTGLCSSSSRASLTRLQDLGIPVEEQLKKINECLRDIDQLLIPSTINNLINQRFVFRKENEIISIFEECDARALNYLISHVKLGLLFYKIKDHRNFTGQHRSQLIKLVAVDRLPILTTMSRVIVLHALQLLKLRANPRAEYWVRNIILNTTQDDLSELKTLTDAKGDYFCMTKLVHDDIRSETIRQDILNHIRREATIQSSLSLNTKRGKKRQRLAWRKVLSDVDDTLCCSGGSYPAGIDRRYGKKIVYPGVLAFYRELDLGTQGPEEEWPDNRVGNLVFLSARPHVYKDMSEKINFAKFEKLRTMNITHGKNRGLHTTPSLLTGDISSGKSFIVTNDFEPLAKKKFENFKRYVSIYPEYTHIFVCDNGQGDVRAAEMMFDRFPYEFDGQGVYVHQVQPVRGKTYGYKPEVWAKKQFKPYFFQTYPEAALHAASKRNPPLIRYAGLKRVCVDAVKDFISIPSKKWSSTQVKAIRRQELNQAIWSCNLFLKSKNIEPVNLIYAERLWENGQKVRTPYGIAIIKDFDPQFNLYKVQLDWRPLNVQLANYLADVRNQTILPRTNSNSSIAGDNSKTNVAIALETVVEIEEVEEQNGDHNNHNSPQHQQQQLISFRNDTIDVDTEFDNSTNTNDTNRSIDDEEESHFSSITPSIVETRGASNQLPYTTMKLSSQQTISTGTQTSHTPKLSPSLSGTSIDDTSLQSTDDSTIATDKSSSRVLNDYDQFNNEASMAAISTMTTISGDLSTTTTEGNNIASAINAQAYATVAGHLICRYSPPTLPKLDKTRGSIFTFWSPSASANKNKKRQQPRFKEGDECSTPYGLATVIKNRVETDAMVVVTMVGWKAHAYLRETDVRIVESGTHGGILGSLLQKFSSTKDKQPSHEFPYAKDVEISTPFGKGIITKPLPLPPIATTSTESIDKTTQTTQRQDATDDVPLVTSPNPISTTNDSTTSITIDAIIPVSSSLSPMPKTKIPAKSAATASATPTNSMNTIGITLSTWTLSNGAHPMLFCTVESAKKWKENGGNRSSSQPGILSKITKLVPFLSATKTNKASTVDENPLPKFEQYYHDSASVSTQFGDGVIKRFRPDDGFYEIFLIRWTLRSGTHPIVYLRKDDIGYRIANNCQEGYPVLTSYGFTGNLASVEPTTGVHIVTVAMAGMVCYLQPDFVIRPLKAAVGEDVLTAYGEGKVEKYRENDDMYKIQLCNCNAILFAKAETFSRVIDGTQDVNGQFGMSWLLRFFFSHDKSSTANTNRTRSRSNSIANSIASVGGAVSSFSGRASAT